MIPTECMFHDGKVDFLLPNTRSCAWHILWRQWMNDRMNNFKLVERGTARQAEDSARKHIHGWQDDDKAVVFSSPTWCPWVPLEMTPFITEWKVLLSFHISLAFSDRGCPHARPLDPILWSFISPAEGGNRQNRLHLESITPSWARLWALSYMPSIYGNTMSTGKLDPPGWKSPRTRT